VELVAALRTQLQEEAFKRLYADRTQHSHGPQAEKQQAFVELCREIREATTEDLWQMQGCRTDWQRVSRKLAAKKVHREGKACFTHYIQVLHPQLSFAAFTKREDMALLQLATRHGGFGWDRVAEHLEGRRTPWQCFSRYQRSLNPSISGKDLTEDEDERLRYFASQCCSRKSWFSLAARVGEGLAPKQVQCYVDKSSHENQHWTVRESRRMFLAQEIYGRDAWVEVARHLPGRSAPSCMHHYWESARVGLKRERVQRAEPRCRFRRLPWTEEEDSALLQAVDAYGAGNWSLICRDVEGRTACECFTRFQSLNPSRMADIYDILLATQHKLLPRGLDGKKRKRSDLVASDFALHLFEVRGDDAEGLDDGLCRTKLTTGDPALDRHLHRVNRRRRQRARQAALENKEAAAEGQEGSWSALVPRAQQ